MFLNRLFPGRRWLHAAVWVLLGVVMAMPVLAGESRVVFQGFLNDPKAQFRIEELPSKAFEPVEFPLARGYTSAATWLKVVVAPSPLPRLVMLVQMPYLDDVQLYSPRAEGAGWQMNQLGDRFPFSARERPEVNLAFNIHPSASQPTTYYLRVRTEGTSLMHVRVITEQESREFDTLVHMVISGYEGLVLMLTLSSLLIWLATRDRLWAANAMFQFVTFLYTLCLIGFTSKYLFPDQPQVADWGVSVLACLQVATGCTVFFYLFTAYKAPFWARAIYLLIVALFPVFMLLMVLGNPQSALAVNSTLVLVQCLNGLVAIWFLKVEDRMLKIFIRATMGMISVYYLYALLPLLGWVHVTEFNLYPMLPGNLMMEIMLQLILIRRTQLQMREKFQLELKVRASDQRLQHEITRHAETASFLGMLMHELKNPLTSIRMASQSLLNLRDSVAMEHANRFTNIQKSVDNIDAVLERCVEVDKLDQKALRIHTRPHDLPVLLKEWVQVHPEADRVRLEIPEHLDAEVDASLLGMMVHNLLTNALTYSPKGSPVALALSPLSGIPAGCVATATAASRWLVIQVRNQPGKAGRPEPDQVFKKYYRAATAHHVSGTGLGLYWVHSVSLLFGGNTVYLPDREEIVFELCLPY